MKWFKRKQAQPKDTDFVNLLDTTTHTVIRMPACELAPGMIQVKIDGIEGLVWVNANDLKRSEYRHPPFCEEIRDYFREIKGSLDEFYCLSIEEWEDGFRRDNNPEKEIAIWSHLSDIYRSLTTTRDLSYDQRHDYFKILLTCLNSPREHVLNVFQPTAISIEEAKDVIAQFYGRKS